MPEINQALILQWTIVLLQYGFLLCIFYFIYRIGQWIYWDITGVTGNPGRESTGRTGKSGAAYFIVLAADEDSGLHPQTRIELPETTTIGRSAKHNTIVIQEAFVSAEHALIQLYDNGYWVSDLSSTNGTMVNGVRIEDETLLQSGDEIKIGSVILQFER
ncbi:MAG TPA: FHA domain-containing protein [Negativicutes bacterium]|nr:FHA domain-containing protein [Negativicutes bacterium]